MSKMIKGLIIYDSGSGMNVYFKYFRDIDLDKEQLTSLICVLRTVAKCGDNNIIDGARSIAPIPNFQIEFKNNLLNLIDNRGIYKNIHFHDYNGLSAVFSVGEGIDQDLTKDLFVNLVNTIKANKFNVNLSLSDEVKRELEEKIFDHQLVWMKRLPKDLLRTYVYDRLMSDKRESGVKDWFQKYNISMDEAFALLSTANYMNDSEFKSIIEQGCPTIMQYIDEDDHITLPRFVTNDFALRIIKGAHRIKDPTFKQKMKKSYEVLTRKIGYDRSLKLTNQIHYDFMIKTDFEKYVEEEVLPMIPLEVLIGINNRNNLDLEYVDDYIMKNYHNILKEFDEVPDHLLTNKVRYWKDVISNQDDSTINWLNKFKDKSISKKDTVYYHVLKTIKPQLSEEFQDRVDQVFDAKYEKNTKMH